MSVYFELILVLIGIIVFFIEMKIKKNNSKLSSKIIYWTVMLFLSVILNCSIYLRYIMDNSINKYTKNLIIIVLIVGILGYIVVQLLSPFKYTKKIINKIRRKNKPKNDEEINEEDYKLRQNLFEVFLETVCWISFSLALIMDFFNSLLKMKSFVQLSSGGLSIIIYFLLIITIPICVRQILFYLFNIRKVREKKKTEKILAFDTKLDNNNTKL